MSATAKTCSAERCTTRVGPRMEFCRKHWGRLTDRLRESIMANQEAAAHSPSRRLDASRAVAYLSRLDAWRAKQRQALGIASGRAPQA